MSNTFRVGIIGADTRNSWAQLSHVPAINALPETRLAAVATRHEASARQAAEAFGAERWYADPLTMIESDAIDIITVVAPEEAEFDFLARGTEGWLRLKGGAIFGVQGGDLTLTSSATFTPPDELAQTGGGPALNVAEMYTRLVTDLQTGSRTTPDFALATHNAALIAAIAQSARWSADGTARC